MKQIIVNVRGLSTEEKQRVNEALAKITGATKLPTVHTVAAGWLFAPASSFSNKVATTLPYLPATPTHTPQQVLEMAGMTKQGHPHANLMAQYAEDAKTTDKPWELWQIKGSDGVWLNLLRNPAWVSDTEYRRKPKTKLIHGAEIPDIGIDLSITKERTDCYTPCIHSDEFFFGFSHHEHNDCSYLSTLGITYPYTEEGKQAAILHAKAMLGIGPYTGD